ncbi:uncharacterized protein LOC143911721 [Arctopsyche grandis]|uniref:uncharacterized protein LOC143911721 n=1 Tax=Arctopsyche grandis TaxID=121162 RepID=UPI00406D788A
MYTKILLSVLTVYILNNQSGVALGISSKLEFGDDAKLVEKSNLEIVDDVQIFKGKTSNLDGKMDEDSKESAEDESTKIKVTNGKSEKLREEDVVCNGKKCVIEIENASNGRKTLTDIHVKISTASDDNSNAKKENKSDDYDVPIIKGYASAKPEDINKKDKTNVGVHVHNYNPSIVRSEDSSEDVPSIYIQIPKGNQNNWHDYLDSRFNTDQRPHQPTHGLPQRPYQPSQHPQVFHPYNIGNTNSQNDHHNYIPSGWTSGWKPISPSYQNPGDYYHYNVNNKENGFSGSVPQYVNYCSCTRKPVYPQKPTHRPQSRNNERPLNPWFSYETTPKTVIDDKISPPFSNNKPQRRGYA